MTDNDTQIMQMFTSVMQSIGRIEAKIEAIEAHQSRQNGRVFKLADEVVALQNQTASREGRNKVLGILYDVAKPVVGVLVTVLVLMMLRHTDIVQAVLTGK